MNRKKLLSKLSKGEVQNVAFKDLMNLVEGFGFALDRISGSHHIYSHVGIPELVNLQDVKGKAKPYQIRQLLKLVERYNLELEVKK
jgi:predicted RNA binding protein YcfA (HicA-like mRNA interferase family)